MLFAGLCFSVLATSFVVSIPFDPQRVLDSHSLSVSCHDGSTEFVPRPAAQGLEGVIINEPAGNNKSGTPFTLLPRGIWIPIKSITAFTDSVPGQEKPKVVGISVQWYDGKWATTGTQKGRQATYDFEQAELISKFWILAGEWVNSFFFIAGNGKFRSEGSAGDKTYKLDVGNGWLVGFEGTSDSDGIHSLSAVFQDTSDLRL